MAPYEVELEIMVYLAQSGKILSEIGQRKLILEQLYVLFMWFRLSAALMQHLQAMAANLDGRFANDGFYFSFSISPRKSRLPIQRLGCYAQLKNKTGTSQTAVGEWSILRLPEVGVVFPD